MNKLRAIAFIIVALFCSDAFCQKDSTWNISLVGRHSSEIIPSTGKSFRVNVAEAKFEKGVHTLIPFTSRKSIHEITGHQFGLAYYKKLNWGYTHADLFYSPSLIFPKTVLRANVYATIFDGVEANIGASQISYANGNILHLLSLGGSYYYKSLMFTYNMRIPLSGYIFHSLTMRKSLNNSKDHLQFRVSRGLDDEGVRLNIDQAIKMYSLQFSLNKTIFRKTQLQVSFGLIKAIDESVSNEYFNYSIGLKRDI